MFIQKKMYSATLLMVFFMAVAFGTIPVQAAPNASLVGVVDYLYLLNQQPETAQANDALRSEQEARPKRNSPTNQPG
ncbi:hypothetical protein [Sporomusa acidovorans]|uniref:Secreted protein n=1 Tax=Sporomusa acidovorans (strain ATCC 49682 / DSM 3132 / Mol) TaxID=1123286 RepID=A0ABZ3IZS1_SPOA4|nr:hypothetical protein [Sporomusa acidovorans]OZC13369.1 hypothetical protein SPACI_56820 [Sporomusa acidovorans DSM 3132]SDF53326.1 hypothetical protein SAMN04488499_105616 [Sporomusa acidovorans]